MKWIFRWSRILQGVTSGAVSVRFLKIYSSLTKDSPDPKFALLIPKAICKVTPQLRGLISSTVSRILDCSENQAKEMVGAQLDSYGKLRWKSGETIHARRVVKSVGRDMSYIKVRNIRGNGLRIGLRRMYSTRNS